MKRGLGLIADSFVYPLYIGLGLTLISFLTILILDIEDTTHELFEGVWSLQPYAILEVGILILILSPFFAMLGAVAYFLKKGDRKHSLLTILVIIILTAAIILGTF